MNSVADSIETLGMANIARSCGLPYSTVASWKARGSIPPEYWLAVVELAAQSGVPAITADLLARLHARPPGERA